MKLYRLNINCSVLLLSNEFVIAEGINFHIRFVSDPKNGHKWNQLQARHAEAEGSRVAVAGRRRDRDQMYVNRGRERDFNVIIFLLSLSYQWN